MTHILAWVALVLGGLIVGQAGVTGLRARPRLPAGTPLVLGFIAAVLVLGALATLPTGGIWSGGQTLAPGFLLGGASILAVFFLAGSATDPRAGTRAAALQIGAPALGAALLLVLYPTRILDPLIGFGLGAVAAACLASGWLGSAEPEETGAGGLETAALAAVSVAAATYLATLHLSPTGIREWQPLPALFAAGLAACLLARAAVPASAPPAVGAGVAFVPLIALAALVGFRLNGTPGFLWAVLAGLAVSALIAWLETGTRTPSGDSDGGFRPDFGLVGALLVLGGAVLAFRGLHGYGLALMALAGAGVMAALPGTAAAASRRRAVGGAVALALLLALYRVFTERTGYTRGFQPEFLYYYVALIAGALLPQLLGGWSVPTANPGQPAPVLVRLATSGLVAATAPLAVWVLIGERPQAALLVGLAIGTGMLQAYGARTGARGTSVSLARLYAVGMALVAVQFTHLLEPLALRTRQDRIVLLAVVAVITLVGVGASLLLERRAGEMQPGGSNGPLADPH